MKTKKRHKNV